MSIQDALNRISDRHPDVIGAMVSAKGKVWHNLEAPYDMVSADKIMESFGDIFEQTDMLADNGQEFGDVMMDFDQHSFIARSIDGGHLVVLAPRLQRGQLVKLQVGLGLFGKSVQKAISEEAEPVAVQAAPEPAPVVAQPAPVVEEQAPEVPDDVSDAFSSARSIAAAAEPAPAQTEEAGEPTDQPRAATSRRGAIAARMARHRTDAHSEPKATAEPAAAAEPAADDGAPLRPDGTPMKKRIYRGVVFYE